MNDMAVDMPLRRFTVEEYHRMADAGILADRERVELIDGVVVEMSPIGTRHWMRHARTVQRLNENIGRRVLVVGQGSFPLGLHDEPQPDIALLATTWVHRRPVATTVPPDDIWAMIEIADSSLRKDTGVKRRLYGRFGIADYLAIDVASNALIHHADPHELGYRTVTRRGAAESLRLSRLPDVTLEAAIFLE